MYCRHLNLCADSILEQLQLLGFSINLQTYDNPLHKERLEYCQQKKHHTKRRMLFLLLLLGIAFLCVRAVMGPILPINTANIPIPFTSTNNDSDASVTPTMPSPIVETDRIEPLSPQTDDSLSSVIAHLPPPALDIDTPLTPHSHNIFKRSSK